jgi:hypothetical protein
MPRRDLRDPHMDAPSTTTYWMIRKTHWAFAVHRTPETVMNVMPTSHSAARSVGHPLYRMRKL